MKIWFLPSYKSETPSSQMRVHRVADIISCPAEIIPYDLPINKKFEILKAVEKTDFVLVQKWRNEFNRAKNIKKLNGIKIFDMDDICEDAEVLDLAEVSDILFMANHFLLEWAKQRFPGKPVYLVPTGIDIPEKLTPYNPSSRHNIVIAKYGVDRYIGPIARIPGWKDLFDKYNIAIRILGTLKDDSTDQAQRDIGHFCKTYNLVPLSRFWEKYGKILSTATVGIMPLGKNAQGKSGFSVLTMMAAGLPVIASPYGECEYIIKDGVNGFIANSLEDWKISCEKLFLDPYLRSQMSVEATKTIVRSYSMEKIVERIEGYLKIR